MRSRQLLIIFVQHSSLIVCLLLAQSCCVDGGESRDLYFEIASALNNTEVMAAMVESMHWKLTELKDRIQTEVISSVALAIDSLDTIGVSPDELLYLQYHSSETLATSDDFLGALLSRLINYRALAGKINEHLISDVGAVVLHGLPTLIEDTDNLIAQLDFTLDAVFSRCDLLTEIILGLARIHSDQEAIEVEQSIKRIVDSLANAYTSIALDKLAFETRYLDALTSLRLISEQMYPYV